jgi:hypothetical protein
VVKFSLFLIMVLLTKTCGGLCVQPRTLDECDWSLALWPGRLNSGVHLVGIRFCLITAPP